MPWECWTSSSLSLPSSSDSGSLSGRARRTVAPFDFVAPGTNGGVSWPARFAAAAGALVIAAAAVPLLGLPRSWVWLPAVAGFAGCQLDSVLGATVEGRA